MMSKTNINNGNKCLAITIISLPLFTDLLQSIAFLLPFMRVLRSDVHFLRLNAVIYIFYFHAQVYE